MLQATRVFKLEHTRQNQMYWLSRYCFQRSLAVLKALASCGHKEPDPRVDKVWPSTVDGQARNITIAISRADSSLDEVVRTILTNSILHTCSAFEALLDGLYMLGLLYKPELGTATKTHKDTVTTVLNNPTAWQALLRAARNDVIQKNSKLKGPYSLRVQRLCQRFRVNPPAEATTLDQYYTQRHVIAHDQGLAQASDPATSYKEIMASRVSLTESEWKAMMGSFWQVAHALDKEFTLKVVPDSGLAIAIWKEVESKGPQGVGLLQNSVKGDWGLDRPPKQIEKVARAIGRKVSTERTRTRRTVG